MKSGAWIFTALLAMTAREREAGKSLLGLASEPHQAHLIFVTFMTYQLDRICMRLKKSGALARLLSAFGPSLLAPVFCITRRRLGLQILPSGDASRRNDIVSAKHLTILH